MKLALTLLALAAPALGVAPEKEATLRRVVAPDGSISSMQKKDKSDDDDKNLLQRDRAYIIETLRAKREQEDEMA